jgi:hypothetical protein
MFEKLSKVQPLGRMGQSSEIASLALFSLQMKQRLLQVLLFD